MKFAASLIIFAGTVLLVGCTGMDPWNEMALTPSSRASTFIPRARVIPQALRPMPEAPREIQDGPLTLGQCIKIGLERNPETRSSWLSSRSTAAAVGETRAAYLPTLELTSEARRGDPASLNGEDKEGPESRLDTGFRVRHLLFAGGERISRVRVAEAELLAANFRHNTVLQDVALSVQEAYYQLLGANWGMRVAEETVKQAQYHVELAVARHTGGLVARSDVLKAETEKAAADLSMVRARSALRIGQGHLANAMGLKVSRSFEIEELSGKSREQESSAIDRLLDEAAQNRPELQSALAQVEARRAEVRAAQARYWPILTTDAGYGWRERTSEEGRDTWSVGIGLSFPIFTGFHRAYQVQRAKYDLAKALADHASLLRGVELEVWIAYSRLIESSEAVEAAEKLVASAEESAQAAEAEYKSGAGSIIELIDAQTARTAANSGLVQAKLDWYTATARLERALGRMLAGQLKVSLERKGDN